MIEYVLSVIAVALFTYYYFFNPKKDKFLPPGPKGIPLLGFAPFLGRHPAKTFTRLSKVYGPIFSVQLGTKIWVVLNEFDLIQETLVKQGHIFSGRANSHMTLKSTKNMGIVNIDYGDVWKNQRKFGLKTLKEYGYGKRSMETMIIEEVEYLCEVLRSRDGKSFYPQATISNAIANIICALLKGSRFPYDDERFVELIGRINSNMTHKLHAALYGIMLIVPIARFFPVFWTSYNRFFENIKHIQGIIQEFIDDHKKSFDLNNINGYIDEFLKEMKENKEMTEPQLLHVIHDFIVAGTETSSTTLRWSLLRMSHFPDCQEKIWQEIQNAIGESGIPSMKHQDQMPYTCAFIHEVTRHRTLIPFTVAHKTSSDVTVRGYEIPKDTPIIPNLWAVHNDERQFPDPEQFRPERFIDDNNCFVPSPHVIPFSVGPRACLGEQLAKMEVFLFLVGILQKFRIVADPEKPLPPFDEGVFGLVYGPNEFQIKFMQR